MSKNKSLHPNSNGGPTPVAAFPDPPRVRPLQSNGSLPFWSVMIPTFNPRRDYLEQAIGSVIGQGCSPQEMQIEVVDDCSSDVDVASMVQSIAGSRVTFQRNECNLGLAGCWNSCVERSRGEWIHILHQDDFVDDAFYQRLRTLADLHPDAGLLATRSFLVDEDGIVVFVTPRVLSLENGGNVLDEFFYQCPIRCPGVVVRRRCYEEVGGFREDLKYSLDCEMWARVIKTKSGFVTSEVLANYRSEAENQSRRLWRSGEALEDVAKLNALFAEKYQEFDPIKAQRKLMELARVTEERMLSLGEIEGARACRAYWKKNAPVDFHARVVAKQYVYRLNRWLVKFVEGAS